MSVIRYFHNKLISKFRFYLKLYTTKILELPQHEDDYYKTILLYAKVILLV